MNTSPARSEQAQTRLDQSVDDLLEDSRQLRSAALQLEAAPAEDRRYADEVAQLLSILDVDLTLAKASLTADRVQSEQDATVVLDTATSVVRRWMDEAVLQADLAGMEIGDLSAALGDRLERVGAEARRGAERIAELVDHDADQVRLMASQSVNSVREVFADAARSVRHRLS